MRLTDDDISDLELRGPRLTLRRWRPDDAERVHEVMSDRSMYHFDALPDPYTMSAAHEFVGTSGHEGRDHGSGMGAAVVETATNRLVGAAALRVPHKQPEVGYWVAPDARGHGYAAEVSDVLARAAFGWGHRRVGLYCDVRNVASVATALRAGFSYEGTQRDAAPIAGRGPADLACFGRTADDPGTPIAPVFPRLPAEGLRDGTITLRPLAPDDADEFHELDDELAARVGFGGPARTMADDRRQADRNGLDLLVGGAGSLAIEDDATGGYAGGVTMRRFGPPRVWLLGYTVHPLFRGRGYTTRALRLLAPWAFEHGIHRLELGAKVDNVASQRAALAAGFAHEGTFSARLRNPDGTFSDEQRFCLLAP